MQEREELIAEVVAERRRLAEENAAVCRAAEEARANLLDLKTRVAQYEAQAAAALRQAHDEEARAAAARETSAKERATLDELKRELQVGNASRVGASTVGLLLPAPVTASAGHSANDAALFVAFRPPRRSWMRTAVSCRSGAAGWRRSPGSLMRPGRRSRQLEQRSRARGTCSHNRQGTGNQHSVEREFVNLLCCCRLLAYALLDQGMLTLQRAWLPALLQGAALSAAQDRLEAQRQDLLAARLELDR